MAKTVSAKVGNSVSTLELFFDLVFVFAITQVTAFIAADLTWSGLLKGLLVLALVYWSWIAYSWLGTAVDVDQPAAATYLLTAMGAMFIVAVLIPQWYSGTVWAAVAAVAYAAVRFLHIGVFVSLGKNSPELRNAALRLGVTVAISSLLVITGAAIGGNWQVGLVTAAVIIDPLGVFFGKADGWYLSPHHFAERHGLIMIIALGESLIAVGLAVSAEPLTASLIVVCLFGVTLAALVYVFYFRRNAPTLLERLALSTGAAQPKMGRDVFSYGHFALIAGIVLLALALKKTVLAVADYDLSGHVYPITAAALTISMALVIGGIGLIRLRAGAAVGWPLWLALLIAMAAAALSATVPTLLCLLVIGAAVVWASTTRALPSTQTEAERARSRTGNDE